MKKSKLKKYVIPLFIMFIFISSSFVFIGGGEREKDIWFYILPGNMQSYQELVTVGKNTTLGDILDYLGINYTLENSTLQCVWDFCRTNNTTWNLYVGNGPSDLRRVEFDPRMNVWNYGFIAFILEQE